MKFSLSGLDLKLLFMVTGAYYESGQKPALQTVYNSGIVSRWPAVTQAPYMATYKTIYSHTLSVL